MTPASIPLIDLKRQYASMKEELDAAVHRVIDSAYFINGRETEAFEREWAAYCETGHCVAVGSGTGALNLTLKALGVGPGDEVITVSFTLGATLDAIVDLGATPVLVDVQEETFTLDVSQIATKISPRTKAILPVNVYGHPADMDAILAVADAHGLPVIVDACESHGALYKGRQATAWGTASCFSFYPTKNLNGMGDGGGVVTNDGELAAKIRRLRHHGWDARFHSAVSSLNSRMDELQAAVLRAKLPRLDAWNARRIEIAGRFDEAIGEKGALLPAPRASWAHPSYYLYVLRTRDRVALRQKLTRAEIGNDIYWPEPPHLNPGFAHLGYEKGSLPVTERLCDEVLALPMFPELTEAEVGRICAALHSFGKHAARARS